MFIEIEGSRRSDSGWRQASEIATPVLWERTKDRIAWSDPEDPKAEKIARAFVATEFTEQELFTKCVRLQRLASDWLRENRFSGNVAFVRLRCFRGMFDLGIDQDGVLEQFEVREDTLDDLLQAGSQEASQALSRLFSANLGLPSVLKAS